jgi:biopolymer transport protein ExbD
MTVRRKSEAGPEPNLPVTPMLDMAFQLLAFFVMTYHPSDLEGQMELSLPSENISKANSAEEVKADAAPDKDKPIDLPVSVTVIVRTQRDNNVNTGTISGIIVEEDVGKHPVETLDKLLDELKTRRATAENKENIKIQADAKLKWSEVISVVDVCKQAGFTNVSFAPPPG